MTASAVASEIAGLPPGTTPEDVVAAAARHAGLAPLRMFLARVGRQRGRAADRPAMRIRAACAWILRERFGDDGQLRSPGDGRHPMSMPDIARRLGYDDHTSVLYHLRQTCARAATMDIARAIEAEVRRERKAA